MIIPCYQSIARQVMGPASFRDRRVRSIANGPKQTCVANCFASTATRQTRGHTFQKDLAKAPGATHPTAGLPPGRGGLPSRRSQWSVDSPSQHPHHRHRAVTTTHKSSSRIVSPSISKARCRSGRPLHQVSQPMATHRPRRRARRRLVLVLEVVLM